MNDIWLPFVCFLGLGFVLGMIVSEWRRRK
jgi:hypothetical protein